MRTQRGIWWSAVSGLVLGVACGEPAAGPEARLAPSFSAGGVGRPAVLVNPNAGGNGTATTIQEGIDTVAQGGKVMVLPGTYFRHADRWSGPYGHLDGNAIRDQVNPARS